MKVKPYNKRTKMNDKKAIAKTSKTMKPVAKDTNKTKRSHNMPRGRIA